MQGTPSIADDQVKCDEQYLVGDPMNPVLQDPVASVEGSVNDQYAFPVLVSIGQLSSIHKNTQKEMRKILK